MPETVNCQEDRQAAIAKLRKEKNRPKGYKEVICYSMIGYVVPHSKYYKGYTCNAAQVPTFINRTSQKICIPVYHWGSICQLKIAYRRKKASTKVTPDDWMVVIKEIR